MVDVGSLQTAYNDAVARGNKQLAKQLLALWRDALVHRTPERSLSTGRDPSEGQPGARQKAA
jgi:hypothetical protein